MQQRYRDSHTGHAHARTPRRTHAAPAVDSEAIVAQTVLLLATALGVGFCFRNIQYAILIMDP
jgi:nitroreductase